MSALGHVRVIDLTDLRGALAGRMLADLGADVLKIEPPGGDPGRLRPPFAGGIPAPDCSLPFLFRNANKRAVVVDLRDVAGWRRLVALAEHADIVLENLDADDELLPRLAELRIRHPHLIHVAIADFGRSGPRAGWRLEPLTAFAASGALYASGFPDRAPCWLPGYLAHDSAAVVAVTGALAALLDRARDGAGQRVEVSVQEAALSALDPWAVLLADYARTYPVLPESYPRDADGPALVLRTADGWVRMLAVTPRQWRAFVALLTNRELPDEAEPPHRAHRLFGRGTWGMVGAGLAALASESLRVAGVAVGALAHLPLHGAFLPVFHAALGAVRLIANEALAARPRAEVLSRALQLGLPMAPVNTLEDFVAAEQTEHRGYFRRTGFPHVGDAPMATFPANLGRTPAVLRRPAPRPGEDDEVGFAAREPVVRFTASTPSPVLSGLRVINLGVGAVVPEVCGVLAALGAEVIKIESRSSPDFLRRVTVESDAPNRSWMFNDENRGQRSVCLDLRTARGRELALRLCTTADVVAENRQGGLVRRWGLDYEDVRRVRPDVVYVSSQGYGRGGPLGEAPAFGPLLAAFAGATHIWNHLDAPYPAGSSLEHPDHLAGKLLAVAVLAALEHRRRTGEGQHIEMAQTEATAYLLGELYLEGPCTGRPAAPRGNAADYACPHGVYPSAGDDCWCAIAVVGEDAWSRFQRCLGWAADHRFDTLAGRLANHAELDRRVAAWTRGRSGDDAAAALQAAGVSAMSVQGPLDHRADPHLAARSALVAVDDPEIGPVRHVVNPLRLDRAPLVTLGPAPRLGADTREVLTRLLGIGAAETERLVVDGVVDVPGTSP